MSWQGNKNNTPPNKNQETDAVSGVRSEERRDLNVRRDTDTVKNVNISLIDIDTTIFNYIDKEIAPHVITDGNVRLKVPIIYGSPERWKGAKNDGILRDYDGKIQLPVIMFKRNSVVKNESLMTLNRHLSYPVMTKYTEKNKYDKFSLLNNNVNPVNTIHMITLPDHIKITYNFMIWTELVEQMNTVIEKINFSTEDYWGDKERYRFRVYGGDYTNNMEVSSGKDRMVRTEFSLTVMAYIQPDSFEDRKLTHQKLLTPRKIVVSEGVSENLQTQNVNNKKIKASLVDGYIQLDDEIKDLKPTQISFSNTSVDAVTVDKIKNVYLNLVNADINSPVGITTIWHDAPAAATSYGEEGWMAYDGNFHYIYANGSWRRQPITNFNNF